jgi:pimeloyl-ACP methyl ester carboxylesterase
LETPLLGSAMATEILESWIEVDGLSTHLLRAGESGSPVVLLHGGGLDWAALTYRCSIGPLAESHRVFAPDLPGFGGSAAPPQDWGIAHYVQFLGRLLDVLELERASLVGISLGGAIALGFALRSPERVVRLVLVDSHGLGQEVPGRVASYLFVRLPLANALVWTLLSRSRRLVRKSLHAIFHRPAAVSEELVDEVYQELQGRWTGKTWRALQRSEVGWHGARTNYLPRFHEVAVPTLIVHGANDRLVPVAWAERAHAGIEGSQLHIIPECGHWPPREAPAEFNQVVARFLADS